jgi:hypothetical protein
MSYACIQDSTPPTIQVSLPSSWQTVNTVLSAQSTDQSGVLATYWNAHSLDNSSWQGNPNTGQAYETMTGTTTWSAVTGTWTYSNGNVVQTDEASGNTNFALAIPLTSSDDYLFEWRGSITGAGTNRRAGIHFMCSDLNLPNRGNSYFVWFRVDTDIIQLYEVTNDVFSVVASFPYAINPGQTYHCQTTYNLTSGTIRLYIDGEYLGEWIDATPLQSSNGISLRSGNAQFNVDYVGVSIGVLGNDQLLVGPNGHFFQCNPSVSEQAGRVLVQSLDIYDNWGIDSTIYNVDFTPPILQVPTDGLMDSDTLLNTSLLDLANLIAIDTNSGISQLLASVEEISNGIEILAPFAVTMSNEQQLLNGLVNQADYRIKLSATNGASLTDTSYSDGFVYINDLSLQDFGHAAINILPNPFSESFEIIGQEGKAYILMDLNNKVVQSGIITSMEFTLNGRELSAGLYLLHIGEDRVKVLKW